MKKVYIILLLISVIAIGLYSAKKPIPHIYPSECVGCGDCYRICPVKGNAIEMVRGKAVIITDKCIGCNICIYVCSYGAVR